MEMTAVYICPGRGLTELRPPDPDRLGRSAGAASGLGVNRLLIPVLEESLLAAAKQRNRFLDELIQALDQADDAGIKAELLAPAQRILGLDWVPPYLVSATPGGEEDRVFMGGRIRALRSYAWWKDPGIVQKRIAAFRELCAAVSGHPALSAWTVMDRFFSGKWPGGHAADVLVKSYTGEILDRRDGDSIRLSLDWHALQNPGPIGLLLDRIDSVLIRNLDVPPNLADTSGFDGEIRLAAFLGAICRWFFSRPAMVEMGWSQAEGADDTDEVREAIERFTALGIDGVCWASLAVPDPRLKDHPPWMGRAGYDEIGLLDRGSEPRPWVEDWIKAFLSGKPKDGADDFIDISVDEYLENPAMHLARLWDHFRD